MAELRIGVNTSGLALRVNGYDYGGWESARVTRGIESISGGFELTISDRWAAGGVVLPIVEEDICAVLLNGTRVILGYVDRRSIAIGPVEHTFSIAGRDRSAAMVDCGAYIGTWEFANVSILTLAQRLARPFGVTVTLQPGLALPSPLAKVTIDPGETAFETLERACRTAGLLPVSDGEGGIMLTRVGSARAVTALVEGANILQASVDYDGTGRFSRYVVMGQHPGSEEFNGVPAATVRGEARDDGVGRKDRIHVLRADGNTTPEHARRRAQWEAKVRAGRAEKVSVTVQGWEQGDGSLWPVNARVQVRSPLLGIDGEMLIAQAEHSLSTGGSTTVLSLQRPDAFLPEPIVTTKGERWKELD